MDFQALFLYLGPPIAAIFTFLTMKYFPYLVGRSEAHNKRESERVAAELRVGNEKLAARLKSESAAFDQSLRLNEKLVLDILADKNTRFESIKEVLGEVLLHNRQQNEWYRQFAESIEELVEESRKNATAIKESQRRTSSDLYARRLLNSLIEQIYRKLFSESPDTTIIDDRQPPNEIN